MGDMPTVFKAVKIFVESSVHEIGHSHPRHPLCVLIHSKHHALLFLEGYHGICDVYNSRKRTLAARTFIAVSPVYCTS